MSNLRASAEIYGAEYWFTNQIGRHELKALERILDGASTPILAEFKFELRYLHAMDLIRFDKQTRQFSITDKGREGLAYFKNRMF